MDDALRAALRAIASDLATPDEFAELTRQHRKSVYRRIAGGRQPGAVKVGGVWRIDLAVALSLESVNAETCGLGEVADQGAR